jgi:hypothetical protein
MLVEVQKRPTTPDETFWPDAMTCGGAARSANWPPDFKKRPVSLPIGR